MEQPSPYDTVRLSHTFPAPRARVFQAFTTDTDLARWIWGADATNTEACFPPEPGAGFVIETGNRWEDEQGRPRAGMRGLLVERVQDEKLVYTLRWEADVGYNRGDVPPLDEVVTVTFHDDGDGCRIEYVHHGIPADGLSAQHHAQAIQSTFTDLEKLLSAEGP